MNSQNILALANKYSAHTGLALATISTYATGSGDFFKRLQAGHDVTLRRAIRIIQWFSDHYPADLTWPIEIDRPTPDPDSPAAKHLKEKNNASEIPRWLALNDQGEIADPRAFIRGLFKGRGAAVEAQIKLYYQVVSQYSAGGRRAAKWPRKGSIMRAILDHLRAAGDVRFRQFNATIKDSEIKEQAEAMLNIF